jgi:hypothetical protein
MAVEITIDWFWMTIGINVGITIGFWSAWWLFGRKKDENLI